MILCRALLYRIETYVPAATTDHQCTVLRRPSPPVDASIQKGCTSSFDDHPGHSSVQVQGSEPQRLLAVCMGASSIMESGWISSVVGLVVRDGIDAGYGRGPDPALIILQLSLYLNIFPPCRVKRAPLCYPPPRQTSATSRTNYRYHWQWMQSATP